MPTGENGAGVVAHQQTGGTVAYPARPARISHTRHHRRHTADLTLGTSVLTTTIGDWSTAGTTRINGSTGTALAITDSLDKIHDLQGVVPASHPGHLHPDQATFGQVRPLRIDFELAMVPLGSSRRRNDCC